MTLTLIGRPSPRRARVLWRLVPVGKRASRSRDSWPAVAVVGAGFLAGSIPFSNLAARWSRGVDLREVGSGTVSGTGLYRVAGFGPLAAAGVLEVAKGSLGPLLATRRRPGLAAIAGGAAVVGHNWSPWLRGAGGRGISPALGALLAQAWPGTVTLLAGMVVGRFAGETAIGSLAADVAVVPLLGRLGGRDDAFAAAAVVAPMIVKRLMGNGPVRGARGPTLVTRLVLDRDRWTED